ncbi:MAG: Peptidase M23 [Candidatus Collierbacteria bacterium GW2011_GWC1_45_47]|uniref:Peptidase M23 n=3 Tax=Candidatus Collieribacteriota TaxID=1752725 RepID=A0A0G1KDH9_9BACT|nr:MAG: Peptidase M23 [Candidatus Collierbacteria bacterium GW2011_GWA1_44_12]KKT45894.1 MAG: Peptidase M23 [Candidatus Collierbacteria bacterium GW2011_GWF2_44_15]KKU08816.1 MAG: Peptidase M23 [Candidatus Collierbacteria bacterium GW2011_GWC1_45_47]KKU27463.1 MAG: Peptidase M23 [Candidatus Collierbacteria bacterium GW2011_GWE1_46_18]
MPNDDLGQFPAPAPVLPVAPIDPDTHLPTPEFEETPDVIPSPVTTPQETATEAPPPASPETPFTVSAPEAVPFEASPEPEPLPTSAMPPEPPSPAFAPQPLPAVAPTSGGSTFRTIIFSVLFFVALGGLAAAAFLFQQTTQLRTQLSEITQTLDQQRTQPPITPTPTIIEIPTGSPTPGSTISATLTPSPTVIPVPGSPLKPLSVSSIVLKIGIDYQPNAQFILLKTDNANSAQGAISKYFFRQDLNTKKYFYVLVSGTSQPEIIDRNIQVTPDNNIPSLNSLVLEDKLGIDLDEALRIVYSKCSDQTACQGADTRAQYIQTSSGVIWQISLFIPGKTQPMVMQINAQTKNIVFRTSEFIQD